MADLRYKVVVDENEAKRRLAALLKGAGVSSNGGTGAVADTKAVDKTAESTKRLKDAQLANIESIRRLREERSKEIGELNVLKQLEQEAKILLAEKRLATGDLTNAQKQANIELAKSRKDAIEHNKILREQANERRRVTEEERKAAKVLRDAEKARKDAERAAEKAAKAAEQHRKQLEKENSEYYKLNKALFDVRKQAKDVLAEMFKLERQGRKGTIAYEQLRIKSEALTKQTQLLDRGLKKIDTSLGLHQRYVGEYGRVMEAISPVVSNINQKLALFGTSIDQLATKPGAIKELGVAFMSVGKGILSFLLSPIGFAITALSGLFMLFNRNKQTVIDFNNGLLNVSKTTGLSGVALQGLSDDIISLSRSLQTVSTDKLLQYATVAGQLGVKGSQNILAFTEALAKLETASDISGEQGGAEIARLLTLTDGGVQNVKQFGDEIVNLGNNFAATEKEILGNAEAISQNVGVYRIGRQEILAFATATKSVGLEAEVVGSTFSRTLGAFEKTIRTGKGVGDLLKIVGGNAADLSKRFKDDAAGVFIDYVSGLNKIHKEGGSVNAALEKTGVIAVRDQRVIASLASNGFEVLTDALDKVRNATGAMDAEFETAAGKLVNQTNRIGIAWDNLVLSVENGEGAIGKASVAIMGFFADMLGEMNRLMQSNSWAEFFRRIGEIGQSGGGRLMTAEDLRSIYLSTKDFTDPRATTGRTEYFTSMISISDFKKELDMAREHAKQMEKAAIAVEAGRERLGATDAEINQYKKQESLAKLHLSRMERIARQRGLTSTPTAKGGSTDGTVEESEAEKKKREAAEAKAQRAAEQAAEQQRQAFERQRALQLSIDQNHEMVSRNALSRDQQEIASIKDKYNKMRDEARKFYADPRNKVNGKQLAVDLGTLEGDQKFEIREVTTRQGTTELIADLTKQKEIYDEYYAYLETTSKEEADKRFKNELALINGYRERLNAELLKIASVQELASLEGGGFAELTQAQKDRADYLRKLIEDLDKEDLRRQQDKFNEAMRLAETLAQGELRIREKYQKALQSLGKNATEEQKEQLNRAQQEDLIALIEQSGKFRDAMKVIEESSQGMLLAAFKTGKQAVYEIIRGLKQTTDKEKSHLKKVFGKFFDDGIRDAELSNLDNISQASQGFSQLVEQSFQFRDNIDGGLSSLSSMVKTASQLAGTLGKAMGDAGKGLSSAGAIGAIAGALLSLGSAISTGLNEARMAKNSKVQADIDYQNDRQLRATEAVTRALQQQIELINEIYGAERLLKYTESLETIKKNWKDINSQLGNRFLMTHDARVNEILERLNNGESRNQIMKSYSAADAKNMAYLDSLFKAIDRGVFSTFSLISSDITEAREELAKLQYQASLGNVDDYTQKLIDQLQAQMDLYDKVANQLREENTGNTFSTILGDVKSLFFNSGEDAGQAWSDGFDKMMENYAIQKFSRDWLEKKTQDWYTLFDDLSEGGLDKDERSALKEAWDAIQSEGQSRVDELRDTLGLTAKDASSSLKSGGIERALTESTGTEIVGMYRANLDIAKQQLTALHTSNNGRESLIQLANQRLASLNAIQVNTYNTVQRLDVAITELKGINKAVSGKYEG